MDSLKSPSKLSLLNQSASYGGSLTQMMVLLYPFIVIIIIIINSEIDTF